MEEGYSLKTHEELVDKFRDTALHRPMQIKQYEAGTKLVYEVTGVVPANKGKVHLLIDKFVGGGFAGQVYRVKAVDIELYQGPIEGLKTGSYYAMKILIPPSGFSLFFRNFLYWIGFQGPFQLQVNPVAARSGALWQKFIRRGAKIWFGDERTVVDIFATFVDDQMGSCGELSEWIEGRTWRLEVDEHLDYLKKWKKGKQVDVSRLGSPEYRTKYDFMHKFVGLLHEMGGFEFARQYEWSTWKSQPNCLKRQETEESPLTGLVAVDFRAGLALLPFLPMSPGDFKLIIMGLLRGSLVQFDRGDLQKLERFITANRDEFVDMLHPFQQLKKDDQVYRNSIPDITHNHFRLLYSPRLWSTMMNSFITGWKIRKLINDRIEHQLRSNILFTLIFYVLGILPLIGRFFRRIWGQTYWRRHYAEMLKSWKYFRRAVRGKIIEKVITWHRSGRIDKNRSEKIVSEPWQGIYHLLFSILPVGLHRFLTDWDYAKEKLDYITLRPLRLYFKAEIREQWLRDMVSEGKKKHLLTDKDVYTILAQIKEPFIQKYLKSLAVHVCTLPVTQIVSLIVAIAFVVMHPEMSRTQSYAIGFGILALFQVTPISPGSIVRGLYVVYLVIKERNFKDYNIAVFLGFFKYIGYLAFPIQMAYHYPTLARFMAGHWATEAVHIVPVFGEGGAIMEHGVFSLFYNWPLTIRRRMRKRAEMRAGMKPRYWHLILCSLVGTGIFAIADLSYLSKTGILPGLKDIWFLTVLVPLLCGVVVTLGAGGVTLLNRVFGGAICGTIMGILYSIVTAIIGQNSLIIQDDIVVNGLWRVFIFTILSTFGVILTEIKLPEPKAIKV
jgi:hypothetical protein